MTRIELLLVRGVLVLGGLGYAAAGAALLAAPEWFFASVGPFPPFNRHYSGDLGAFLLPLGIGLLWAARRPRQHVTLIAVTSLGSLLHSLNHAVDAVWQPDVGGGAATTAALLVVALVALLAVARLARRAARAGSLPAS